MTTYANQAKNTTPFVNQAFGGKSLIWNEATFKWNEAAGTWQVQRTVHINQAKNNTAFTNESKSS